MTTYNFQAHDTKNNLATWDCFAYTEEKAIEEFIHILQYPGTANDDYEVKLHKAIIEKLGKKEYRVNNHPEDNEVYITIIFSEEEVNQLIREVEEDNIKKQPRNVRIEEVSKKSGRIGRGQTIYTNMTEEELRAWFYPETAKVYIRITELDEDDLK